MYALIVKGHSSEKPHWQSKEQDEDMDFADIVVLKSGGYLMEHRLVRELKSQRK